MSDLTFQQIVDALLIPGARWSGLTVTFSVPGPPQSLWASIYGPGSEPFNARFGVLNATQKDAFVDAVAAWDRLIPLRLVFTDDAASPGQIRIALTDARAYNPTGALAYAYHAPVSGSGTAKDGDIWFDHSLASRDWRRGTEPYEDVLHELGHALGLKHPFDGRPLPVEWDNTRWTVMSYTDFQGDRVKFFVQEAGGMFSRSEEVKASTPMLLDIIAIQALYGASLDVALGDDVYTVGQGDRLMLTLVDNGGEDTFDFSAHTRGSRIDLVPGHFSSVGLFSISDQIAYWVSQFPNSSRSFIENWVNQPDTYTWSDNLMTSLDTVIENVRAGRGEDTIIGNAAANEIYGGAGSDQITGGAGDDFLRGEDGGDFISGGDGFDDLHGNMGNDLVFGGAGPDWVVGGKDNDSLFGEAGDDIVLGNLGSDTCEGGEGADIVRGGQDSDMVLGGNGADFLAGDRGSDTIAGGGGADIFHTHGEAGLDRVLDFNAADGDRVNLLPGTTYTLSQVGADTVINMMGGGQMILVGVNLASLREGWIYS